MRHPRRERSWGKKEEKKRDRNLSRGTKMLRQYLLEKKKSHKQRTKYPQRMGSFENQILLAG